LTQSIFGKSRMASANMLDAASPSPFQQMHILFFMKH